MRKNGKRLMTTAAACVMVGAMALGGTMAYLTDNEAHVNTFTVGKVQIDLEEPGWDPEDGEDIVPNEEIEKDPKIENTGTNLAYVFAEVKIPAAEVVTAGADGTKNPSALQDLFTYGTVKGSGDAKVYTAGGLNEGWYLIQSEKAQRSGEYRKTRQRNLKFWFTGNLYRQWFTRQERTESRRLWKRQITGRHGSRF